MNYKSPILKNIEFDEIPKEEKPTFSEIFDSKSQEAGAGSDIVKLMDKNGEEISISELYDVLSDGKQEEIKPKRIVLKRAPDDGYEISDEEWEIVRRLTGEKEDKFKGLYLSSEDYDRIYKNVVGDVLAACDTQENVKTSNQSNGNKSSKEEIVYPGIIEDDPKYENWSGFCNIDAFSKQGCQNFPKVTGRIRHKIVEYKVNENIELAKLAEGLRRTREALIELCETNPEQAKELAIEALIRTGVIESNGDIEKAKTYTKEGKK